MDLRNFILRFKNSNDSLNFNIVNNILDYVEKYHIEVFSAVISTENTTLLDFQHLLSINNNIVYTFINKRGKYRDNIINKDYEYLNISPKHINKNEALNFLGNHLDISKKNILAIGDNVNDLEMVRESGIGVAVNEANDEIKNVSTYITKSTDT